MSLPAFLITALALFVVASASAAAASLITSANIKDGSIQNRDLRDGAFTLSKLRDSTIASLREDNAQTLARIAALEAKAGIPGPAGANGANGANGASGATGSNGSNGLNGSNGTNGTNGTNGANGATGATGSRGATGDTGAAGTNGTNGQNGATGATGAAGSNGTNGQNGATGATGPAGASGPAGPQGPIGPQGPQGPIGPTGPQGTTGTAGAGNTTVGSSSDAATQGFTTSNPTVSFTSTGAKFGPYADNNSGGSVIFRGANIQGKTLKDIAQLAYTTSYTHDFNAGPDNGDAPYLRVFIDNDGDGFTGASDDHDVIFSPSTQPGACAGPLPARVPSQCNSSGRSISYDVDAGLVRYDDDGGNNPDISFAQLIADHGNDKIESIRVSTGFSLPGTKSGLLSSLSFELVGQAPRTYAFGS